VKVLLHICCAPCTVYPLKKLKGEGHEVTGFFYNPNIHPYTEFQKRLDTVRAFAGVRLLPILTDEAYEVEQFLEAALPLGKDRCLACYRMRLDRAFKKAKETKAEAVTTTLLYSRYQRHDEIAAVAHDLSNKLSIAFLYRDFREGWKEGQDESRRLGLYRQSYCGCIFSEAERFRDRQKASGQRG